MLPKRHNTLVLFSHCIFSRWKHSKANINLGVKISVLNIQIFSNKEFLLILVP